MRCMKVFNLKCDHGHPFEGWFRSHMAFEEQKSQGLLSCPFCDSRVIEKTLSAPRLNLSGAEVPAGIAVPSAGSAPAPVAATPSDGPPVTGGPSAEALAAALTVVRQMLASSEDVGDRFAEHARAMHAKEVPARAIHGQTSAQTAQELLDEGIPVLALPFPGLLKTPLQ